jgi:hypothetical protein
MPSIEEQMRMGMFVGGIAPYGYQKDPSDVHHLIINDETAKVVRDIYNWMSSRP